MGGDQRNPWFTIYWVAIVFISSLLHEFGHVLAMRLAGMMTVMYLFAFCAISSLQAAQDGGRIRRRY